MQTFTAVLSNILEVPVGNVRFTVEQPSDIPFGGNYFLHGMFLAAVEFDSTVNLPYGYEQSFGSIYIATKTVLNLRQTTLYRYTARLFYGKETEELMKSIGESFQCTRS